MKFHEYLEENVEEYAVDQRLEKTHLKHSIGRRIKKFYVRNVRI